MTRCAAVILAIVLASCERDPVRVTVDRLYEATAANMASALVYTREPAAVTASWEIRPDTAWEAYVRQIRSRVEAEGFTPLGAITSSITFRRILDGDSQFLQLRAVPDAAPMRVVATFTSRPL